MKIAIIDTQGPGGITPAYRARLPGVAISGVEPESVAGTPCHAHGAMCGWLAALPLVDAAVDCAELVFIRCFDSHARWIAGCDRWLIETLHDLGVDYVSRSWGAWDGDDPILRQLARASFAQFAHDYAPMIGPGGIVDFGAAGNDDANDADEDVAYPQAAMPTCNVIGAHDRRGVPCRWSGDGRGVLCTMWADRIWSPDASGAWHLWSGTSAATPKACGVAAAHGFDLHAFRRHVETWAERPIGYDALPHPKWGWGSMENAWQALIAKLPASILPPMTATSAVSLAFHDYRLEAR